MSRQEIRIIYMVNDTTCNAKFTCESSSITMGMECTSITMVDGLDEHGRETISAMYRQACSILRFAV